MNLKEYYKASERTFKPLGQKLDFLHCISGLITEFGEFVDPLKRHIFYGKELDVVNLKEELGDIMWYLAIPIRHFGLEDEFYYNDFTKLCVAPFSINENISYNYMDMINDISYRINKMNNNIYHSQFNKSEEIDIHNISEVLSRIISLCTTFKIDFEDMLETNINKLKARFPEKFTEYHALNRDLVKERNILEGVVDNE